MRQCTNELRYVKRDVTVESGVYPGIIVNDRALQQKWAIPVYSKDFTIIGWADVEWRDVPTEEE